MKTITYQQAQSLIDSLKNSKIIMGLIYVFSTKIVLREDIEVGEEFEREIKSCIESPAQKELFESIFEKEEVGYKKDDLVVITGEGDLEKGTFVILSRVISKSIVAFSHKGNQYMANICEIRHATQQEKDNYCPYEDGELIMVKLNNNWALRISNGRLLRKSCIFYEGQKNYGKTSVALFHAPANGLKLPTEG